MENRILNLETKSQENNNDSCEEKKGKWIGDLGYKNIAKTWEQKIII